jgi:hypothetical protein
MSAVREIKIEAPRKTDNLSRSVHPGEITGEYAQIIISAVYAGFVEFGTKGGQIIVPVTKKALRWAASAAGRRLSGSVRSGAARGGLGGVVFAKRVIRGATPVNAFVERGFGVAVQKAGLADAIVMVWNSGNPGAAAEGIIE